MCGLEKFTVLWAFIYTLSLAPFLLSGKLSPYSSFTNILVWIAIFQNFLAMVLTIRDLYKRYFPEPNEKLTWCLLITWTGGIGWLAYLCKYGLKPRIFDPQNESRG
jgi:hypothetical protein